MVSNKKFCFFAVFVLCLFASAVLVSAISPSILGSRAIVRTEVGFFGTTIERIVTLENRDNEPLKVTIKPANETLAKMVDVIDKEFILEGGESRDAQFNIKIREPGTYEVQVNVFFTPVEGTGAGIAYPVKITVIASDKGEGTSQETVEINDAEPITGEVIDTEDIEEDNNSSLSAMTIVMVIVLVIFAGILIMLFRKIGKKEPIKLKKRSEKS